MTAIDADQTHNDCDDVGTGGPGAPTPLVALEVLALTCRVETALTCA